MASTPDVVTVIAGMTSDAESARKLAAYHLQSLLADHAFADAFVQAEGIPVLRRLVLEENGNALAYALGSLTRLLDIGLGWEEGVSSVIIERVRPIPRLPNHVHSRFLDNRITLGCPIGRLSPRNQCPSQRPPPTGPGRFQASRSAEYDATSNPWIYQIIRPGVFVASFTNTRILSRMPGGQTQFRRPCFMRQRSLPH